MKPSWCASLPVVSVPQSDQPKAVTLVLPYYENAEFLAHQFWRWGYYPGIVKSYLRLIVVDDGSPTLPAEPVFRSNFSHLSARLFRIERDIRWNWLAARNIGAHHAEDGWLLLTDMDHVIPKETAQRVIYGQHDPAKVYAFSRTGDKTTPHSASFLMTRKMFWKIGAYDEKGSGFYGNDGPFRREIVKHAEILILNDHLECHERAKGASTGAYERKQPEDANRPKWAKPHLTLSFPYHEVSL